MHEVRTQWFRADFTHRSIGLLGVAEQGGEGFSKWTRRQPIVMLEGCVEAITNGGGRDCSVYRKQVPEGFLVYSLTGALKRGNVDVVVHPICPSRFTRMV